MDIAGEVISAEKVIRSYIRETYLEYSPFYSRMTGAQVYFKLENLQHTGSFKLRGAMNKLLSLTDEEKERGVVTASTGNHGAACSYYINQFLVGPSRQATAHLNIVVPRQTFLIKM